MSEPTPSIRSGKRRRAMLISVGLLATLVVGGLALAIVEKLRDVSDRAT